MATFLGLLFESTKDATLDPNTFNYSERKIISTISWLFTIYVEIVSFVNILFMPLVREQERKAGRYCNASRPVERSASTIWTNWTKFYRAASKNVNALNPWPICWFLYHRKGQYPYSLELQSISGMPVPMEYDKHLWHLIGWIFRGLNRHCACNAAAVNFPRHRRCGLFAMLVTYVWVKRFCNRRWRPR
jgi:hypothetical protein